MTSDAQPSPCAPIGSKRSLPEDDPVPSTAPLKTRAVSAVAAVESTSDMTRAPGSPASGAELDEPKGTASHDDRGAAPEAGVDHPPDTLQPEAQALNEIEAYKSEQLAKMEGLVNELQSVVEEYGACIGQRHAEKIQTCISQAANPHIKAIKTNLDQITTAWLWNRDAQRQLDGPWGAIARKMPSQGALPPATPRTTHDARRLTRAAGHDEAVTPAHKAAEPPTDAEAAAAADARAAASWREETEQLERHGGGGGEGGGDEGGGGEGGGGEAVEDEESLRIADLAGPVPAGPPGGASHAATPPPAESMNEAMAEAGAAPRAPPSAPGAAAVSPYGGGHFDQGRRALFAAGSRRTWALGRRALVARASVGRRVGFRMAGAFQVPPRPAHLLHARQRRAPVSGSRSARRPGERRVISYAAGVPARCTCAQRPKYGSNPHPAALRRWAASTRRRPSAGSRRAPRPHDTQPTAVAAD